MSENKRKQITDSNTIDMRWTSDNVAELSEAVITDVNGWTAFSDEVPEYKDGKETGQFVTKNFIYLKIDGLTKTSSWNAHSNTSARAAYGSDIAKWKGKKLVAIYGTAFGKEYLFWKAKGAKA